MPTNTASHYVARIDFGFELKGPHITWLRETEADTTQSKDTYICMSTTGLIGIKRSDLKVERHATSGKVWISSRQQHRYIAIMLC